MNGMEDEKTKRRPVPVRCPVGGRAPCIDDLCHGGGRTMCGLEWNEDFCVHGYIPETCETCWGEDDDDEWFD